MDSPCRQVRCAPATARRHDAGASVARSSF